MDDRKERIGSIISGRGISAGVTLGIVEDGEQQTSVVVCTDVETRDMSSVLSQPRKGNGIFEGAFLPSQSEVLGIFLFGWNDFPM